MALINLTEYGTGLSFYIDDSQIEMVYSTVIDGTTVSQIQRSAPHNTGYNTLVFVTQNLAAILGASGKLISLSISKDGNQFVTTLVNASINHFGTVQAPTGPNPPATANSQFDYFHNGSTMEVYYSTATPAAIAAAIVAKGPQLA